MLDPSRRDDQAVEPRRIEDEAQRGLGHFFAPSLRRSPEPLDRGEGLRARIADADFGRMGEAAPGRWRLADAIFAGQEAAREWTERGVTKPMPGAVGDQ